MRERVELVFRILHGYRLKAFMGFARSSMASGFIAFGYMVWDDIRAVRYDGDSWRIRHSGFLSVLYRSIWSRAQQRIR